MESENGKKVIRQRINQGFERRFANLENLMVVVCDFTDGPKDFEPPHHHEHEQITYVAEGQLVFRRDHEDHYLTKGDIICVPSGISHCIKTLSSKVTLVDSFSPVRKDFFNVI